MPPHIYITVLEDLYNTAQMFVQRKKAVVLLPLPSCHGDFVKMYAFQNGGAEWSNNTVQYVENNGLVA